MNVAVDPARTTTSSRGDELGVASVGAAALDRGSVALDDRARGIAGGANQVAA